MRPFLLFLIACFCSYQLMAQDEALEIDDNTIVQIDSMITMGNKKVRDVVIFGESKLKQRQEIPLKALRKELLDSRRNLLNTRLFNDVEILIYKWTDDNHVSVEFVVDERFYIYPIPVLELTGISIQEWQDEFDRDFNRLTYGMKLIHTNFSGNADRLRVDWRGGFQKQYGVTYELTGVDKQRNWGAGIAANYLKNKGATVSAFDNLFDSELFDDFVYESKSAGLSISRRKDITRRHGLTIGFSDTKINDSVFDLNPNFFVEGKKQQRYGTIGYNFLKEKRNLSEYPTDGEFYAATASYGGLFDDDYEMLRFSGKVSYYEPLGQKFFFSTGVQARYTPIYNDSFFTLVNSRMLDMQTPRGYNDYQLFPVSFATAKSELRYQLLDKKFKKVPILPDQLEPAPLKVYPKIFFDAGQTIKADHDLDNPLNNEFLYSIGAGVDIVTLYNTPLIMELARNHNGETSVNFGIGKSF